MPKVAGGSDSIKHQRDAPGIGGLFHAGPTVDADPEMGALNKLRIRSQTRLEVRGTEGGKLVSGMM